MEPESKTLSFNLKSMDVYVPSAHCCTSREEVWAGAKEKAPPEQLMSLQRFSSGKEQNRTLECFPQPLTIHTFNPSFSEHV